MGLSARASSFRMPRWRDARGYFQPREALTVAKALGAVRTDAVWIIDEPVPSVRAGFYYCFVTVPNTGGKLVGAGEFQDVLHRVQLGGVGREGQQRDVVRHLEFPCLVPAALSQSSAAIEPGRDLGADLMEMQVHAFGIGGGCDACCAARATAAATRSGKADCHICRTS
jgi:hypothetical protein